MTLTIVRRRGSMLAAAIVCCLVAGQQQAFAQFLGIFGDKNVKYKTFKDPAGRFELEYPNKDWSTLPSGGSAIAILSRNDRTATVVVDLSKLTEALTPAEVATNAQIELEGLKEQHPNGRNFTSELVDSKAGRASLIRYARIGTNGQERVMRYSVGVGLDLYRLDAVVEEASVAKYEAILLHMLMSFTAPAGAASSKN
jgi:PsbP